MMNNPGVVPPGENKPISPQVSEPTPPEVAPQTPETPAVEQPAQGVVAEETSPPTQEEMKIVETAPSQEVNNKQVINQTPVPEINHKNIGLDDVAEERPLDIAEAAELQDQIG